MLSVGRSCNRMRSRGGNPNRRKPSTTRAPMMLAWSMPSAKTGHGVRATQRTNSRTRPRLTGALFTNPP